MLRKKSLDSQYMGPEPVLKGKVSNIDLIRAFNWYNYHYTVKDSKKWLLAYMKSKNYTASDIAFIEKCSDTNLTQNMCSTAKLLMNGVVLKHNLDGKIKSLLSSKVAHVEVKFTSYRENTLLANLHDLEDKFTAGNYKPVEVGSIGQGASKTDVESALKYYNDLLNELMSIDNDKQLKEAYSHLTKKHRKTYIEFVQKIIYNLSDVKTARKPRVVKKARKKKVKTAQQIVKKLNYLPVDTVTQVESIDPATVIGSTILWTFNTKTRKLVKYIAKNGQTLSIKGTSVQNFDEVKSFVKNVRKPATILHLLKDNPKSVVEKLVTAIRARPSKARGRINNKTLLLRVFK